MKIIFCGFRHGHINGLYNKVKLDKDFEIIDCVEPNDLARSNAEKNLGATFSGKTYQELLNSDIEVVAVGTAYGDRGNAIISALKKGKHVIADKPICTTMQELKEIETLCRQNNLKVSCLLDLRYIPQTIKAKEILDSGELGEIINVSFTGQHCIDYDNRPSWYFEEGMHGGTINDLCIHGVDIVRYLTGKELTKIDFARVWNGFADKTPNFKDCAYFSVRLNDISLIADVSYSAPSQVFSMPTYWDFKFWCKNGLLTYCLVNNKITIYKNKETEPTIIIPENLGADCLQEFKTCIAQNNSLITENVIKSTKMALTIQAQADKEN